MYFQQVIGQQKIKQSLLEMVKHQRIPHALLFLGASGVGKLAMALAFAQYVLCEQQQEGDSCGRCRNCIKAGKLIHPDIHFSYPVVGSKITSPNYLNQWRTTLLDKPYLNINEWLQLIGAENKQGNINKEECLRIIKQMNLKSFEGGYKILIIWLPEYLQKEGNRLLKLIEEPPDNTLFILVAEEQDRILNTILSRCQLIKFNALSDEELIVGLIERAGISKEQAISIVNLSDGNFNEALALSKNSANDNAILFLEWMRKSFQGNGGELVNWAEHFARLGRERQKHFFKYGLHFMRQFMLFKMTGIQSARLQPNELNTVMRLSKVVSMEKIEPITQLLNDNYYYVERNANSKIIGLDISIQMNRIFKN